MHQLIRNVCIAPNSKILLASTTYRLLILSPFNPQIPFKCMCWLASSSIYGERHIYGAWTRATGKIARSNEAHAHIYKIEKVSTLLSFAPSLLFPLEKSPTSTWLQSRFSFSFVVSSFLSFYLLFATVLSFVSCSIYRIHETMAFGSSNSSISPSTTSSTAKETTPVQVGEFIQHEIMYNINPSQLIHIHLFSFLNY